MKKYLVTGLIILLPLALTIFVIKFFFNLLTDPFAGAVKSALHYFGIFNSGFWLVNGEEIQLIFSKILILIFLFAFTVLLGFLTSWFLIRYLIKIWDYILHRIPVVRTIYKGSQDVISTIFSDKNQSFKQVVMVPFSQNAHSIGFVTRDDIPSLTNPNGPMLAAVFIPTTPNPTSGFLFIFEKKDLIYLDMKVEEAFKCILSCGVISKKFTSTSVQTEGSHDTL